ncbi:MAG: DUF2723 domain-containing protein [Candidatus Magnetomorum sp.]|nr:DUF2723 domain-containing protein [Candidatus Magnetomorum sp.]
MNLHKDKSVSYECVTDNVSPDYFKSFICIPSSLFKNIVYRHQFSTLTLKQDIVFPFCTLLFVLFIYLGYCIDVHTWESYFYAGSLDQLIPVSDMAPPGRNLSLPYNNLLCIYYTQHPLLYFMVYVIHIFLPDINPLTCSQMLNILSGMLGLLSIYLILKKVLKNTVLACQGVLLVSCLDVYWYQSLSGEVYIGAFSFLSLSLYALLHVEDYNKTQTTKPFLLMCIFLGIAVCFHLYGSLFGVVIAIDILKRSDSWTLRLKYLSILGGISCSFFIAAYILPYFMMTSIQNLFELSTLLFIHSKIWGIWQIPDYLMPVEMMFSIFVGCKHLLNAMICGNGFMVHLCRIVCGCWMGIHIVRYLVNPQKERILSLCLLWFGTYFIVLTTIIHVPAVNDNWCLCLFPLILFMMHVYRPCLLRPTGKGVLWIVIASLFMINGANDIFPKRNVPDHEFFVAKGLEDQVACYRKIIFMGNHNILSQAWYVFYQINEKRPHLSYLHPPYEYPHPYQYQQDLLKQVRTALNDHDKVLIISAENDQWIRLTFHLLRSSGYDIQPVFQKSLTIDPKTYKVALGIIEKPFELKYVAYRIQQPDNVSQ